MLVLSRKSQERIWVTTPSGEHIVIQVVDIRGERVRVGVMAPRSYTVDREEVYLDKKRKDAP